MPIWNAARAANRMADGCVRCSCSFRNVQSAQLTTRDVALTVAPLALRFCGSASICGPKLAGRNHFGMMRGGFLIY